MRQSAARLRPRRPSTPPSQGEERGASSGAAAPLPPSLKVRGEGRRFHLPPPPPRVLPTSAVFPDYATHCRPAAHKAQTARPGTPSLPLFGVPTGSSPGPLDPMPSLDTAPLWSSKSPDKYWRLVPPSAP